MWLPRGEGFAEFARQTNSNEWPLTPSAERERDAYDGVSTPQIDCVPVSAPAARSEAGYQGMGPDELDCLLCDEVADHAPLVALLARPLVPLDEALAAAVRASSEGA